MTTAMKAKKELLASQVSNLVSDTNENLLRVNLSKFFTDLEAEIQKALIEYWNDTLLLQGQINLILSPIHEKHQEYYELIMTHKLQEFRRAQKLGERLVKREQEKVAMKAAQPVKFIHNEDNLFGTLEYTEERLSNYTFTASQNTLNRVDGNINEILTTGYREGKGINEVSRKITERFDQLRTWEAKRIARTEIHTSQNMGIMSSYESLGVEYTQWSAAHDSRTRHSHIEIDGEIIPFGGTYSNKLRFPGDTSGPVEEWINCRCANAPFVLPAGMMAPSFSPFRESDLIPISVEPTITEPTSIEPTEIPQTIPEKPITTQNRKVETNSEYLFKGEPKKSTLVDRETRKTMDVYEFENIKIAFDRGETALTFEEVKAHIDSLPPIFKKTNAKIIKIHDFSHPEAAGSYTKLGSELRLYNTRGYSKSEILDTFTHELAHSIDSIRGSGYLYSIKEKYEAIFKADNKLYRVKNERTGRFRTPKKFPTSYAGRSWQKFKKSKDKKHMLFVEDFAESTKEYFNPLRHEEFCKNFPNRAKYLEEIYGKPVWDKNSPMMKAVAKEGDIKKIREDRVKEHKAKLEESHRLEEEQDKKFEKLSKKELDEHLKEILSSDNHVKAYYGMKEELAIIEAIEETIMLNDPKPLMDKGYSKEKAKRVLENPNYYLNKNREKKNKYKSVISEVEKLVKQRL